MHGTLPVRSTYNTPLELDFSQEEFDALAWFVDQYDAGKIVDLKIKKWEFNIVTDITDFVPDKFWMEAIGVYADCGTAGCILGYVSHKMPLKLKHFWPRRIHNLFYGYPKSHKEIKAADARDATVRVLRGQPAWL